MIEGVLKDVDMQLIKIKLSVKQPFQNGYRTVLEQIDEFVPKRALYYLNLIGIL